MKYLVLTILTITSLLVHAQEDPDVPPIPNSYRVVSLSRSVILEPETVKPPVSCQKEDKGLKCLDCKTLALCPGGATEADFSVTCSDQTSKARPYCNESGTEFADMCTATDTCPPSETASDFLCPGDGIFPSLTNCQDYYSCSKGVPTLYRCRYNTIYNHSIKFCLLNSVCYTVAQDCGTATKIIPYKPNNTMSVLCKTGKPAQLKACTEGLIFNPTRLICVFQCTRIGIFADPEDTTEKSFYRCFYDGRTYQQEKLTCEQGQKFDKNLKYCVGS